MTYRFAVPTRRLGAELDQLFDAVLSPKPAQATPQEWSPATTAIESEDRYVLTLDLPGVTADQVQVVAENGRLRVSGERTAPTATGTAHLSERRFGRFARTFRLPSAVDGSRIDAQFAHGVLTITLPKREPAITRTIEIKTVQV